MNPTLISIIEKTEAFFKQKGLESARLNAELLAGHFLNLSRLDLYLQYDRPVMQKELDLLREAVGRRAMREPLQYITGKAYFRNITLNVSPAVLIPRPETETLVEACLNRLQGAANKLILDYGTGSGCVGISLAQENEAARIDFVDSSKDALDVARENATINKIDLARTTFRQVNELSAMKSDYDCIVSNPPYIPSDEIPSLQPEVQREPIAALDGGRDGLNYYRGFATDAAALLAPQGSLFLEIGYGQAEAIVDIFKSAEGWQPPSLVDDLEGNPRVLIAEPIS